MLKHTLLVWLITCALGTMLLWLGASMYDDSLRGDSGVLALIALGVTLVLSIPAVTLYGAVILSVTRAMPAVQTRTIASLYGMMATASTFVVTLFALDNRVISDPEDYKMMILALPYAVAFAAAAWIVPLPARPDAPPREEWTEEDAPEPGAQPPASYFIIATIIGLSLLYSLSSWIKGDFRGPHLLFTLSIGLFDLGLSVTALYLFLRWKPIGWKLLVALTTSGLAGSLLNLASNLSLFRGYHAELYRIFLVMGIFAILDAVAMVLLARNGLRARYRMRMKEYGLWAGIGVVWAVMRMALFSLIYRY